MVSEHGSLDAMFGLVCLLGTGKTNQGDDHFVLGLVFNLFFP